MFLCFFFIFVLLLFCLFFVFLFEGSYVLLGRFLMFFFNMCVVFSVFFSKYSYTKKWAEV